MVGVLSHYISKPDIIKTTLIEYASCFFVSNFRHCWRGGGESGPGGCFYFGFLGTALFSRIHFFGMRSLFWGDFWASIFFNGVSNSPTSSSLRPSSCLSLSSSSLNSSLSAIFSKSRSYAMNHYWNLRNIQQWCVRCMIWCLIKHKNTFLLQFLKMSDQNQTQSHFDPETSLKSHSIRKCPPPPPRRPRSSYSFT